MKAEIFRNRYAVVVCFSVMTFICAGMAETDVGPVYSATGDTKITIGGMAAMENGEFCNSLYLNRVQPNRPWLLRTYGRLNVSVARGEHLKIVCSPEIKLWYDTYKWQDMANEAFKYPFNQHSDVYLAEAQGILHYDLTKGTDLNFAAGVFEYKYNDDVKNLGEYLFRTGAKPAYIQTSFDFAYARMTGFRLNSTLMNRLTMDLMLTSETVVLPARDWSISFLCNYSGPSFYSIGAGVMFDRLFPADPSLETPKYTTFNRYYTETGEEKYMSFGGTKLMAHASFDPKKLFSDDVKKSMGPLDGKIYVELAVLGTSSFTTFMHPLDTNNGQPDTTKLALDSSKNYYSDIKQRIPVTLGFNIPAFRVLDYLSTEFEWYGWPYPNSTGYVVEFRSLNPQPTPDKVNNARVYKLDNWKYSLNFKKTVVNGFSVLGQLSRDHTRHDFYYKGFLDLSESLTFTDNISEFSDLLNTGKWGSFGWWVKLQYKF